jgi:hypothetical protein
MRPLSASDALDRYYLEARSKLLDLAAILDRVERGGGLLHDPRLARIRESLAILAQPGDDHAERLQHVFSLPYDETWTRPTPRT